MTHSDERRAVVTAVFAATGKKVDEDDPIIVAALFQAHTMREAVGAAVVQVAEAGQVVKVAADEARRAVLAAEAASRMAAAAFERMSSDRAQLLKTVEAQIAKCLKLACKGQSSREDSRSFPIWYAVAGSVVGAVVISAAMMFALQRNSVHAQEAAVGRAFARVVPGLDPKLREQLMQHLRKNGS